MAEKTTIEVEKSTREELKEFGKKGDSYDQIIRALMVHARKEGSE